MKKIITMCDPPSGWKYGFPKPVPDGLDAEAFYSWLVSEGYPRQEIDSMGDYFFTRSWQEEVDAD